MKILWFMLMILKIIGITVLSVLASILLLIVIILLVPIRYKLYAKYDDELIVNGEVSFLLRLFKVKFDVKNGESVMDIRYPFVKLIEKIKIKRENKSKKKNRGGEDSKVEEQPETENTEELKSNENEANECIQKADEGNTAEAKETEDIKDKKKKKVKTKNKKVKKEKINIKDMINTVKEQYTQYQGDVVIKLCWELLGKILRALKPKKFKCQMVIGFEDPSVTGMVLGGISMVNAFVPIDIKVRGNFEEEELSGELETSGKVSVISLIVPIISFIFKKPIWKIISEYKKG